MQFYTAEGEGDLYRAIVPDGDNLALEIMGTTVISPAYIGLSRTFSGSSGGEIAAEGLQDIFLVRAGDTSGQAPTY